jgi:hypothetical protein
MTFVGNTAHLSCSPPEWGSSPSCSHHCRRSTSMPWPELTWNSRSNLHGRDHSFSLQLPPSSTSSSRLVDAETAEPPLSPLKSSATLRPTNPDRARMGPDLGRAATRRAPSAAPPQQATVFTASRRHEGQHQNLQQRRQATLAADSLLLRRSPSNSPCTVARAAVSSTGGHP